MCQDLYTEMHSNRYCIFLPKDAQSRSYLGAKLHGDRNKYSNGDGDGATVGSICASFFYFFFKTLGI